MEASAARRPSHAAPRVPARLLRLASDDRLVDHVRGGSEPAFEVMFDRHHRGILAFCRHMLGSADEAEDAVQHTFMAAYRSLLASRRPIQLRPWLYTIARNRCLSVLRARREQPVEHLDELQTENLSAEVQRRQDLRDLLRDVGDLPDEQRAALVLAEVGGISHDEIAQVLGVQREKVKALVFQARSSLIASRDARETPCEEIREQLAELRGGSLRRNTLRRHLKACPGCRDFRAALQDQRKALALALPVVPTVALKHGVMAGALGTGATAAGGAAAGGVAGAGAGGSLLGGGAAITAKVLAVAALAGGGAVGVKAVALDDQPGTRTVPAAPAGSMRMDERAPAARDAGAAGGAAPAPVGGSEEQAPADAPGVRTRRSEQRSKGRRGIERRSRRANERAAGPRPGARQPGPSERALERRAQRRRAERSSSSAGQSERAARPPAKTESVPAPRPQSPPEAAAAAPRAAPIPTPRATLRFAPSAKAGGKGKLDR